jgi:cytochrome c553
MKKFLILLIIAFVPWNNSNFAAEETEREPYNDRYCVTCHGVDGRGNEGVQAPRLAGMEPWYLKRQLENFRDGIRGLNPMDEEGLAMQPMAALLTDESIADIVNWVGSWAYMPAEITVNGNAAAGRTLYQSCAACHGQQGEGSESFGAPALTGQNDWYLVTQLKNFKAGYRGSHPQDSFGGPMRAMANTLRDDTAILNVVSYINSLVSR